RIVIELFPSVSPLACQNFHSLCTGSKGLSKQSGLPLHYKGCRLHRLLPGFILQGGDLQFGNGSGGESIWGGRFKDDPRGLKMRHDCAGVLSMGNSGKHANSSQFFVTLAEQGAPQCDKKHVVFGRVVSGMEVLQLVQRRAAPIEGGEEPCVPLTVVECG
ncbi:cyclophilin-like domain-containing protein, partial [Ochromonadaceae sp. CCMP2298]